MDKFIEYSPWIIVILLFLWQNKVFVTPEQMEKRFAEQEQHLERKFVLKAAYDVAIEKLENGYITISEKLDKIYDILIKG